MNQMFRPKKLSRTTQAGEGLVRWRWTVEEIEAITRAGIIDEKERFELIGGEIIPMASKGNHHEVMKSTLTLYWARRTPDHIVFAQETTFRLNEDTFIEPDFVFFRADSGLKQYDSSSALWAVEVADSSLGWDLGRKALLYSNFGIPELWVINAVKRVIHVHRRPGLEGYTEKLQISEKQTATPLCAKELALTLAKLDYIKILER
jgi:Uma2 family endonuclease